MRNSLAHSLRRLAGPPHGLSDALLKAGAGRQPWALGSLRPAAADVAEAASRAAAGSSAPTTTADNPRAPVAGSSAPATNDTAAGAAAAAAAAAAPAARLPPGHTDFVQRELILVFTCGQCSTRAAKSFSKQAYERGLVIVQCPGCDNKHLIADHMGWFGTKGTVEQFAAERGNIAVRRLADGTLELSPEELLGPGLAAEARAAASGAGAPA